jgi:hypothetical protein
MHWLHAVSDDLIHWQELPIALTPDADGMFFSGSAWYDADNRSGLGTAETPPLLLFYTLTGDRPQAQHIAWSCDGIHFQYDNQNPIVENPGIVDFRDPKVFFDTKGKRFHWLWLLVTMLNFSLQIICAAGLTPENSGQRATIVPASGNVPTCFRWSAKVRRIGCSSSAISGRASPAGPKLNILRVSSTAEPSTAPNRNQPPSGLILAWTIMRLFLLPASPFRLSSAGAAIGIMRRVCRLKHTSAR